MKSIYKYEIGMGRFLDVPDMWVPLTAQIQRGVLCLWAKVDTDNVCVTKKVVVCRTGHDIGFSDRMKYIGTVQDGEFVWHVYAEE